MTPVPAAKWALWALLALPAALLLYRFAITSDVLTDELLGPTGEWSARLIIVALMLTPLAHLFPASRAIRWLVRHRRAFGVGAFAYALLHFALYVIDMGSLEPMLAELGAPAIWTGWLALLCLAPPALTSSDAAMRRLRAGWKRVQRLAYPAALLTLAHWMLVHDALASALVQSAPLLILQAVRLAHFFIRPTTLERKTL